MTDHRLIPALWFALLTSGCATLTPQSEQATPHTGSPLADAQKQPIAQSRPARSLSSGMVYDTLTAEIAAQRGDLQTAFAHTYRAAEQSRSPLAAERATQFALQAKLTPEAMQATQLWFELDPDSLGAHQIAALLTANENRLTETVHHLREVVRIADLNGQNGYLKAAAIASKAGSPEQSLALMQQIIPADTDDPDALYALAFSALRARQYSIAEQHIARALQLRPNWPSGILLLSRSLIVQGKQKQSLEVLRQALAKKPDNTEIRLTYAKQLLDSNQLDESLRQFEVLDQQNPNNPDILFALGVISSELERYKSATGYFERLLTMGKKRSEAHFQLGLIATKRNEPAEALQHFSKVEDNNLLDARVQMASILAQQGKLDEARELLQQLRIAMPQQGVKLHLIEGDLLRDAHQYQLANEVYSQGLEQFPDNIDLLYARALNAADMRRVDLLEEDLGNILKQNPKHADALNALGYTLADQTDRLEEAKSYIQKALSLKPDNPAILDSMGWVEFRMGNLENALEFLQQASSFTQDAEIAAHLGEILWHMNRKQQALEVWRKANALEPNNRYIEPVMHRLGAD